MGAPEDELEKKQNDELPSVRTITMEKKAVPPRRLACRRPRVVVLLVASVVVVMAVAVGLYCYFRFRPSSPRDVSQSVERPEDSTTLYGDDRLTLVTLPAGVAQREGALCLDGGPPSYYIRRANRSMNWTSWVIALQGGGWCWDVGDCYRRSKTILGSSSGQATERKFGGIMSTKATVNPEFYDWNLVMINYCDGASFSGNLETPVNYQDGTIYFRGARILEYMFTHFLEAERMDGAKRVILTGFSAGGLAVFIHGDYIRSLIPAEISLHCLPDAGFFVDVQDVSGNYMYRTRMRHVLTMQNAQGSLNRNCLAAYGDDDKWKCFFAEYTYPHMTTPSFFLNPGVDLWQVANILGLRCRPVECPERLAVFLRLRSLVYEQAGSLVPGHAGDGSLVTSCWTHSQAFVDGRWTGYRVGGQTVRQAFGDWYFGRATPEESRYLDCNDTLVLDCNPSCAGTWE